MVGEIACVGSIVGNSTRGRLARDGVASNPAGLDNQSRTTAGNGDKIRCFVLSHAYSGWRSDLLRKEFKLGGPKGVSLGVGRWFLVSVFGGRVIRTGQEPMAELERAN